MLADQPRENVRHDRLGGAACPIVAFDGDPESLVRQRTAINTLGAALDEDARPEVTHDFGRERAAAGDVPGLGGARRAQTATSRRALGLRAFFASEDCECARKPSKRKRERGNRTAVDGDTLVVNLAAGQVFKDGVNLALNRVVRGRVGPRIRSRRAGRAEKTSVL